MNDRKASKISLHVEDDGCGFDLGRLGGSQLGLGIMGERAEVIGATLTVDSLPGCGTRVIVTWIGKER